MRKGNLEIEIRFRVNDVRRLRKKLREIGSKCTEHWEGYDILFDRKNELRERGRILRLRFRKQWGKKAKLTYKGPYQNHIFKIREELETWIESPEIFLTILKKSASNRLFNMKNGPIVGISGYGIILKNCHKSDILWKSRVRKKTSKKLQKF